MTAGAPDAQASPFAMLGGEAPLCVGDECILPGSASAEPVDPAAVRSRIAPGGVATSPAR